MSSSVSSQFATIKWLRRFCSLCILRSLCFDGGTNTSWVVKLKLFREVSVADTYLPEAQVSSRFLLIYGFVVISSERLGMFLTSLSFHTFYITTRLHRSWFTSNILPKWHIRNIRNYPSVGGSCLIDVDILCSVFIIIYHLSFFIASSMLSFQFVITHVFPVFFPVGRLLVTWLRICVIDPGWYLSTSSIDLGIHLNFS